MRDRLKSKKILLVAAVALAITITVLFAGCTPKPIEINAIDDIDSGISDTAYEYLKTLAGEGLRDRTLCSQGELDAAKYIADEMSKLGYESAFSSDGVLGLQEFKTSIKRFSGEELVDAKAYNVVFSKKSTSQESKGEIILACSYDNLYGEKADISGNLWEADGSYESGAGVATLLTLAGALKNRSCDYDLTFAFFTGGCYEWKGAMNYVDNLDRAALDRIALALNFSMPVGGDNWYIYTGESNTTYGRYLYACGQDSPKAVPKDRNIGQFYLTEDSKLGYMNVGMLSNHYYFDLKDIPTANFLSINWEINDNPLFSEMKGKDNVYHTKNDTLQNMIERKGEEGIKAQLLGVIKTTITALDSSNSDILKSSLDVAKSEMPSSSAQSSKGATLANVILKVVLIASLIAASYVIKTSLRMNIDKYIQAKKARQAQESEGEEIDAPFEQETANDEEKKENKSDEDPFA